MRICQGLSGGVLAIAATLLAVGEARSCCCSSWAMHVRPYPPMHFHHHHHHIVGASAIIVVHLPPGATLTAEGQTITGSGDVRYVSTKSIPIRGMMEVTLKVEGLSKGGGGKDGKGEGPKKDAKEKKDAAPKKLPLGSATQKVQVHAFQTLHVVFR